MADAKKLWELAREWGTEPLELIQLARKHGISRTPNEEETSLLRSKLSGYYDLEDKDLRDLEDFLGSDKAATFLKDAGPIYFTLDNGDQRKYLAFIAEQLYGMMEDGPLKDKIKPDTILETVENLGVITVYRSSASDTPDTEENLPPLHLLTWDSGIAKRILKRHFLRLLSTYPVREISDFDGAESRLESAYQKMLGRAKTDRLNETIAEAKGGK